MDPLGKNDSLRLANYNSKHEEKHLMTIAKAMEQTVLKIRPRTCVIVAEPHEYGHSFQGCSFKVRLKSGRRTCGKKAREA